MFSAPATRPPASAVRPGAPLGPVLSAAGSAGGASATVETSGAGSLNAPLRTPASSPPATSSPALAATKAPREGAARRQLPSGGGCRDPLVQREHWRAAHPHRRIAHRVVVYDKSVWLQEVARLLEHGARDRRDRVCPAAPPDLGIEFHPVGHVCEQRRDRRFGRHRAAGVQNAHHELFFGQPDIDPRRLGLSTHAGAQVAHAFGHLAVVKHDVFDRVPDRVARQPVKGDALARKVQREGPGHRCRAVLRRAVA